MQCSLVQCSIKNVVWCSANNVRMVDIFCLLEGLLEELLADGQEEQAAGCQEE